MRAVSACLFALLLPGCFVDRSGLITLPDAGPEPDGGRDAGPDTGIVDRDSGDCVDMGFDLCDGIDNDCDPATPDGFGAPTFGQGCDGDADSDMCAEGTWACDGTALFCTDMSGDTTETCNATDDDCDTVIDNGTCEVGGCVQRSQKGHSYILCPTDGDWSEAQAACAANGYHLAHIDDEEEQRFLTANLPNGDDYWIGATDTGSPADNTFIWEDDDSLVTYANWIPDDPDAGDGDHCVEIDASDAPNGVPGGWNDTDCGTSSSQGYICETP